MRLCDCNRAMELSEIVSVANIKKVFARTLKLSRRSWRRCSRLVVSAVMTIGGRAAAASTDSWTISVTATGWTPPFTARMDDTELAHWKVQPGNSALSSK